MSEAGAATSPQVFVVDSQVRHITIPSEKKPRWTREGWKLLVVLVGFSMLGIVIEGCLIYNLYQKTEAFNLCGSHPLCHNVSDASPFGVKEEGTSSKQVGHRGIPSLQTQTQRRPFAHLLGSNNEYNGTKVVQWEEAGESIIRNMTYKQGHLIVQQPGYYYIYSKLQLTYCADCTVITHRVIKNTTAYGAPMELMKSKHNCCRTMKEGNARPLEGMDLQSSFLAGTFELLRGDRIYVTLDKMQAMQKGHTENFMGAFMISS